MSIEIFGFDRWTLIGPDIENIIQPRRPYVKVLLGEVHQDGNVRTITVTMYKDIFDGLRNGVYTAAITVTSDQRRVFKVYLNGSEIAFQGHPEKENPEAVSSPNAPESTGNREMKKKQNTATAAGGTTKPQKSRLGNF